MFGPLGCIKASFAWYSVTWPIKTLSVWYMITWPTKISLSSFSAPAHLTHQITIITLTLNLCTIHRNTCLVIWCILHQHLSPTLLSQSWHMVGIFVLCNSSQTKQIYQPTQFITQSYKPIFYEWLETDIKNLFFRLSIWDTVSLLFSFSPYFLSNETQPKGYSIFDSSIDDAWAMLWPFLIEIMHKYMDVLFHFRKLFYYFIYWKDIAKCEVAWISINVSWRYYWH